MDLAHEFYEWACFTAHQSAEKMLKGLALNLGITIWGRSLTEILVILAGNIAVEKDITEMGKLLDIFTARKEETGSYQDLLKGSILLS